MSKTALRKELELMSATQLRSIILDAYSARPEIKEYFEFFLNPDIDGLIERQTESASKEVLRTRRGHSKARVSVLKKLVRDVTSLNPDPEVEIRIKFRMISLAASAAKYIDLTPALENYVVTLAREIVAVGDKAMIADKVHSAIDVFLRSDNYLLSLRRRVAESIGKI